MSGEQLRRHVDERPGQLGRLLAAINDANRPLLPRDDAPTPAAAGDPDDDDSWKSEPLGILNLDDNVETYLRAAGYTTLGQLSAFEHDGFWQCMDKLHDKHLLEEIWAKGNAPWKRW